MITDFVVDFEVEDEVGEILIGVWVVHCKVI